MSKNEVTRRLAAHPRMVGALFTACTLLTAAGNVLAGGCGSTSGP